VTVEHLSSEQGARVDNGATEQAGRAARRAASGVPTAGVTAWAVGGFNSGDGSCGPLRIEQAKRRVFVASSGRNRASSL
jgi:hypothetical protein